MARDSEIKMLYSTLSVAQQLLRTIQALSCQMHILMEYFEKNAPELADDLKKCWDDPMELPVSKSKTKVSVSKTRTKGPVKTKRRPRSS